jgi:hypothetical protein
VLRQVGRDDPLLPLRVATDRNRGWGMIALIVNGLSTFGMMLILTYQLQSVLRWSALATGLALVPFGAATGLGAAFAAPDGNRLLASRLMGVDRPGPGMLGAPTDPPAPGVKNA